MPSADCETATILAATILEMSKAEIPASAEVPITLLIACITVAIC